MKTLAAFVGCVIVAGCGAPPAPGTPRDLWSVDRPRVADAAPAWSFGAAALGYLLPDDADYVSPVVTADRGAVHIEARYAYEDLETGSLWGGWNFGLGDDQLRLDATLMAGWVFGETDGVAPGYRFAADYGPVELSSEGEYLFDLGVSDASYFYSWSELSVAPAEWLRLGFAGQRTRIFGRDREIERGLLLGLGAGAVSFTAYAFEPWRDDRYWVLAGALEF